MINRLLYEPFDVISEFFFLTFNPRYFSFQTTGFGGHGGRLGGPVSPNHRPVMNVAAPRRIYLSGATHNIYTGYGWTNDASEFIPIYSNIHPSYIEFLETTHALFRHTARIDVEDEIGFGFLGQQNPHMRLTSYLPMSYTDIFVGNNRTGSLFRPMRERGIIFDDSNLNHLVLANASGDRRMTELVPRHTAYRYHFLDLDYREPHIQEILRQSHRGIYRNRLENNDPLLINIYFGNEQAGYATLQRVSRDIYRSFITIEEDIVAVGHRVRRNFLYLNGGDFASFDNMITDMYNNGRLEIINNDVRMLSTTAANRMINKKAGLSQDALLADYADFVYANYTSLPDTLPQRVIDLAQDITRNLYTDYDRVRALQDFLIQFPYTLAPGSVPRDRDFVDYFLFDGQEGYCVYYASAMVVMTRAIGLPARYVEGFLLPAGRDPETNLFNVSNRNAHAWAEVYFEGFGWIIVETTAPYVFAMYEQPFNAMDVFAWGFFDWDWDYEEYLRQMGLWYSIHGDGFGSDLHESGGESGADQIDINILGIGLSLAAGVPGMGAFYLIVWHILRWRRLKEIKKMDPRHKVIYYYREILKITEYWKYPIGEEETPHEYVKRLRYRFSFADDTVFMRDLNEIYYRARYAEAPIKEEDAAFMRDCYYELVDYAKEVRSDYEFFCMKYVKSVITL